MLTNQALIYIIGNNIHVHVLQEEETQSIIVLKLCLINGITNTPNKHSEHIVCYIVLVIHSLILIFSQLLFVVSSECMHGTFSVTPYLFTKKYL